jgi:protein arginine N-methyltransferase 1
VITVIQGKMETVELPCKVDVIVSEWMGYFLLFESMLDPVLLSRDKYLKPGGVMFPSHATLFLAPVAQAKGLQDKWNQWEAEKEHWGQFQDEMNTMYDTNFSVVHGDFYREQRRYYLQTSAYSTLHPSQMAGPGMPLWSADLLKLSLDELQKNQTEPLKCSMKIMKDGPLSGFCGYFDAFFRGSVENPVDQAVTLTTAPVVGNPTHWGQQIFGFFPPMRAQRGDILEGSVFIRRQERNHRFLKLDTTWILRGEGGIVKEEREETYYIE